MKVALNSWGNIATGLGSEARWLLKLLPFDRWCRATHPLLGAGGYIDGPEIVDATWPGAFDGIDVVVALERVVPDIHVIPQGVKLVVLTNPEWTSPRMDWWKRADALVARTRTGVEYIAHYGRKAPLLPVPIALEEFPYEPRARVKRVRFANGWGGVHARRGWPEVRRMMRLGLEVELFSQRDLEVPHMGAVAEARDLYAGADLVLVPSRFEGIGLVTLEAMASGALVASTDFPPMSDHLSAAYGAEAWRFLLESTTGPPARTTAHERWPTRLVAPAAAVKKIEAVKNLGLLDVIELSAAARRYVENTHGLAAAHELWNFIEEVGG